MKQKYNFSEVLEFYEQNELNEIFSSEINDKFKLDSEKKINEKSINFVQEATTEKPQEQKRVQQSPIISNIKNISSTSQALAELAKKNQINSMENKLSNRTE